MPMSRESIVEGHDPGPRRIPSGSTLPTARAIAHPPIGRRQLWLFIVNACPYCDGGHHHRGEQEKAGIREAGCGGGFYDVVTRRHIRPVRRAVAA